MIDNTLAADSLPRAARVESRRFNPDSPTTTQAIEWLKTHRYVWFQTDWQSGPRRLDCTSRLQLWKRGERFAVTVEVNDVRGYRRMRLTESDVSNLRLPFDLWHHGITATVSRVHYVGRSPAIVLHQSNGFHLEMSSLGHAINFAKRSAMQLTVKRGRRTRVLVPARAPISGEQIF